MADSLSSISLAMTEVVKLLLQLVKVCGDCKLCDPRICC
jgi:hypothetical protein